MRYEHENYDNVRWPWQWPYLFISLLVINIIFKPGKPKKNVKISPVFCKRSPNIVPCKQQ